MKKALYIHGLASGANSKTGRLLKQYLADYEWTMAEVNHHCEESLQILAQQIEMIQPDVVCSTSLGGFYTICLADRIKGNMIMVNPVLDAKKDIWQYLGTNRYFCKRLNGDKTFELTEEDLEGMCSPEYIKYHIEQHQDRMTVFYSKTDDVLGHDYHKNYTSLFNKAIESTLMGHSMTEEFIREELAEYAKNMPSLATKDIKSSVFLLQRHSIYYTCDESIIKSKYSSDIDIYSSKIGYYSSLEKARSAMVVAIKANRKEKEWENEFGECTSKVFGYTVEEHIVNPDRIYHDLAARHSFDPMGQPIESMEFDTEKWDHFKGRKTEDIHFRPGSIVISLHYNEIGIVECTPLSKAECFSLLKPRVVRAGGLCKKGWLYPAILDDTDDSYLVNSLGEGDTHSHPGAATLFPLPFELEKNVKEWFVEKLVERGTSWVLYDPSSLTTLPKEQTGLPYNIAIQTKTKPADIEPLLHIFISDPISGDCSSVAVLFNGDKPRFYCHRFAIEQRDTISGWIEANKPNLLAHWNGELTADEVIERLI